MRLFRALLALLFLSAPLHVRGQAQTDPELLLATTTSVRDSGLLDALLPTFTERSGIRVRTIAVGSGAALRMGASGDADVLITHAPDRERELEASGALVSRIPFMENYFVIAGPPEDPAGVRDAATPAAAIRAIATASAPWVSRADDSGTHMRERALLSAAGLGSEASWENVTKTGSGMGQTLQVAGERRAYVLSDLGTYLAFRDRVGLEALSRPAPALRNVYSVLRVNPKRFEIVHADEARRFETYLLEPETRRSIAAHGVARFGRPLFEPLPEAAGSQ